jgi:SAM-dependent methyltransferase
MPDGNPAWEELRDQYDASLFDARQRNARAKRVCGALGALGLWPATGRLLDVGCGSGLTLAAMDGTAALRVGCDVRRRLFPASQPALGLHFVQCDGARLPFADGQFDLVLSLAVIGEFPDWRAALADMARCVAPGGALYVTVANGRMLVPMYTVLERLGRSVRPVAWAYARACTRLAAWGPENGFDIAALRGWQYVHVSPYLARGTWPWLRSVPLPLLDAVCRRVAPAFGFAWRRPALPLHPGGTGRSASASGGERAASVAGSHGPPPTAS